MYKIQYHAYAYKALCYFDDYNEAKKVLDYLKEKYPNADISIVNVQNEVVGCFDEFMDKFNGEIYDYK